MPKPRPDSFDAALDPEQRRALFLVMRRGGVREAAAYARKEFGLRPSKSALYRFWQRERDEQATWELRKNLEDSEEIQRLVQQSGDVSAVLAAALAGLARDAMVSRDPDATATFVREFTRVSKLAQTDRKLDLDSKRLDILERKAAQADQAQALASDASLTPAEREQRMREIFGIA